MPCDFVPLRSHCYARSRFVLFDVHSLALAKERTKKASQGVFPLDSPQVRLADKARLKGFGKCDASILAASSHRQDGFGARVRCLTLGELAAHISKLGELG